MKIADVYPDIKKLSIFKNTSDEALCRYIGEEDFYTKSYSSAEEICSPYEDNDSGSFTRARAELSINQSLQHFSMLKRFTKLKC